MILLILILVLASITSLSTASCVCSFSIDGQRLLYCSGDLDASSYGSCPMAEKVVLFEIYDVSFDRRNFSRVVPMASQFSMKLSEASCRDFCQMKIDGRFPGRAEYETNCKCPSEEIGIRTATPPPLRSSTIDENFRWLATRSTTLSMSDRATTRIVTRRTTGRSEITTTASRSSIVDGLLVLLGILTSTSGFTVIFFGWKFVVRIRRRKNRRDPFPRSRWLELQERMISTTRRTPPARPPPPRSQETKVLKRLDLPATQIGTVAGILVANALSASTLANTNDDETSPNPYSPFPSDSPTVAVEDDDENNFVADQEPIDSSTSPKNNETNREMKDNNDDEIICNLSVGEIETRLQLIVTHVDRRSARRLIWANVMYYDTNFSFGRLYRDSSRALLDRLKTFIVRQFELVNNEDPRLDSIRLFITKKENDLLNAAANEYRNQAIENV